MSEIIFSGDIEKRIFLIRGQKVMIDRDLAELYKVPTFVFNQSIRRNVERFPDGFMFRLTKDESRELITNCDRFAPLKHSTVPPWAFTEYGVVMLSSVLRSKRAIQINIRIVQTFIRLRQWALTHKELARRIGKLEDKIRIQDRHIRTIFDAIRELADPPEPPHKPIGFLPK